MNSDSTIELCSTEAIPEGGSKGLKYCGRQLFAVKKRGRIFLYHNRCPHRGLPLNWLPDRFLDRDAELILCSSHGALFKIEDGLCVAGPCPGTRLESLPWIEHNGMVCIASSTFSSETELPDRA
ncbi:Rieske (2Fe-2S) protein [Gilvimarinus sp. F26214L]|uniref:Rieske (2Fe-2S) protein n=1 Tax=Gilvimarinus sp. DZF01 TaxID=3461371 RepID=UPI0040465A1E